MYYQKIYSKYLHKIYEKKNRFFICSDICESTIYGEMYQPLLRHVRFDELKCGEQRTILYENPYYFKLKKNPFQMIEIRIMENLNHFTDTELPENEFDVKFGDIYLVLSFRKISDFKINYEIEPEIIVPVQEKKKLDPFEIDVFDPDSPPDLPRPRLSP